MFFKFVNILALLSCALAFQQSKHIFVGLTKLAALMQDSDSFEDAPGVLAPTGYFDPLGISINKSPAVLKRYREAELKHGRVAMLAAMGILTAEYFHPLFGGRITGAAIYHFQQASNLFPNFWLYLLCGIGFAEVNNIAVGWKPLSEGIQELKDDYEIGNLGFDPFNFKPTSSEEYKAMCTKELQNGRLAMIGVAGMVAQELVNGKEIMSNLLGGPWPPVFHQMIN